MRRAAMIFGLVAALAACAPSAPDSAPEPATSTHAPTKRLSKTPRVPSSDLGDPVVVPDPASHEACRILDWNDLPPDVRPAPGDLSNHVTFTNDAEFCRIDNSEFVIAGPGSPDTPDIQFFKVMALVSDRLAPIEQYVGPGRMITIGGHEAVEIVGNGEPPRCHVVVAPAEGPFSIIVTNDRFPQHDPCEIARSLTEAILRH